MERELNTVWLIRHGHEDPETGALREKGRQRVRAVAEYLRRRSPQRILTSPAQRARETAELLAERLAIESWEIVPTLEVAGLGRVEWPWNLGWMTKGLAQPFLVAGLSLADRLGRTPGSAEHLLQQEIDQWKETPPYRNAVLVTHGELIREVVRQLESRAFLTWMRKGPWVLVVPKAGVVELGRVSHGWGFRSCCAPGRSSQATSLPGCFI